MQVVSLEIRKRDKYGEDYPNEIVGTVQVMGETGKMEVRLFPKTVAAIFRLCKEDVQKVANYNASQASDACENAAGTIEMQIEAGALKQLSEGK
jgi:hypothetical protein